MRSVPSALDRFANAGMPAPGRPSRITASRSASVAQRNARNDRRAELAATALRSVARGAAAGKDPSPRVDALCVDARGTRDSYNRGGNCSGKKTHKTSLPNEHYHAEGAFPVHQSAQEIHMHERIVTSVIIVAALAIGLSGQSPSQSSISAQATVDKSAWSVPRMPDGKPDMQGVWANNGMTPLERPAVWGNRATMTDAELADLKKRAQKLIDGGDAFFADELILGRARRQDGSRQPIRRPATTTRPGCPSASGTTGRRLSSIHRMAVSRRPRREPPSARAHKLPPDKAVVPLIARRT